MKQTRRPVATVATLLTAVLLSACGSPKAGLTGGNDPATVILHASADATGATKKVVDACNASLGGQVTITLQELAGNDIREQLTRRLSAKDTTIDLMAIPVSWTPEFAATGWAEELRGDNKSAVSKDTLAGPLATATYKKHLYAAPLATDTQVLWYRKDLVPTPPATWDELVATSNQLAKQNKPHIVEISSLHEDDGVASLFTAVTNSYGAALLDKSGKHAVISDETKNAATLLHTFATSSGYDAAASAKSPFPDADLGRAPSDTNPAFTITSPTAFNKNVPENTAMVPWPKVDASKPARPTLGGTNLVISSYSKHQKQALKALTCMRSAENMRTFSDTSSQLPVRDSLLTNADIKALVANGTPPLQTPVGDAVNAAIKQTLMPLESIDPNAANEKLQSSIDEALHFTAKN